MRQGGIRLWIDMFVAEMVLRKPRKSVNPYVCESVSPAKSYCTQWGGARPANAHIMGLLRLGLCGVRVSDCIYRAQEMQDGFLTTWGELENTIGFEQNSGLLNSQWLLNPVSILV